MLKPLNRNLIVKVEKLKEVKSASGLIIAHDTEVLVEKATVVSAQDQSDLNEGDIVYYKAYSLSTVKVGDEEYNFLPEAEVLAYE